MARSWGIWVVRGIASILFGVLTFVWPGVSIAAIVLMFGVYAFADGALLLSFGLRLGRRKAPYVVRGLLSIAAGLRGVPASRSLLGAIDLGRCG